MNSLKFAIEIADALATIDKKISMPSQAIPSAPAQTSQTPLSTMLHGCFDSNNSDIHIVGLNLLSEDPDAELIKRVFRLIETHSFHHSVDKSLLKYLSQFANVFPERMKHKDMKSWRRQARNIILQYVNHAQQDIQTAAVQALQPFGHWESHQRLLDLWRVNPGTALAHAIETCLKSWTRNTCTDHNTETQPRRPRRKHKLKKIIYNQGDYLHYDGVRVHRRLRQIEIDARLADDTDVLDNLLVSDSADKKRSLFVTNICSAALRSVFKLIGAGLDYCYQIDVQWKESNGALRRQSVAALIRQGDYSVGSQYALNGSRFTDGNNTSMIALTDDPHAILNSTAKKQKNFRVAPMLPCKPGTAVEILINRMSSAVIDR